VGASASTPPAPPPLNAPMGVGTTQYLRQLADYRRTTGQKTLPTAATPTSRPTTGGKRPRRIPIPNTPSPTVSTASNSRRGRVRTRGGGRGGGGSSGGDSSSSSSADTPLSRRGRRRGDRVLNQAEMQQQLEEILQQQQQTAAGRRIAGITTTNTITTTYKNGRRPTVTRNSTSVRN